MKFVISANLKSTKEATDFYSIYNYLVAGGLDGTTQAAWRPEYANDIGVFHLN